MRSPTDNAADEVKAAIDAATQYLGQFRRLGFLRKAYVDPDRGLRFEARMHITAMTDDVMPPHLRAYVCQLLKEQPTGKATVSRRDACVISAIRGIVGRGFAPTRNAETRDKESACSIVATALAQLGLNLSERTVEDIWNSARDRVELPHIWEFGPENLGE